MVPFANKIVVINHKAVCTARTQPRTPAMYVFVYTDTQPRTPAMYVRICVHGYTAAYTGHVRICVHGYTAAYTGPWCIWHVHGRAHVCMYTRAENGRVHGLTRLVQGRITAVYMYTSVYAARTRCVHCRVTAMYTSTPVHGSCTQPRTG